jgi:hypothetical protein
MKKQDNMNVAKAYITLITECKDNKMARQIIYSLLFKIISNFREHSNKQKRSKKIISRSRQKSQYGWEIQKGY